MPWTVFRFFGWIFESLSLPLVLVLKALRVRVLAVKCETLGHLAMEPDLYLRSLASKDRRPYFVMLFPYWGKTRIIERFREIRSGKLLRKQEASFSVANQYLLKCWNDHFVVIDSLLLFFFLYPILRNERLKLNPYGPGSVIVPFVGGYDMRVKNLHQIYRNWEKDRIFAPFIKIRDQDVSSGLSALRQIGIPEGVWFICFSAREPGYYPGGLPKCRNFSLLNLEDALLAVIRRGGYCVRVGSSKTSKIPDHWRAHSQIIDYAHSPFASDFMDVFLLSKCRFSLGPMSGISEVPRVFGVPCVMVNTVPFGLFSPSSNALNIFKLQKRNNTVMKFSECLQSYLSSAVSDEVYDEFQVELVENTKEEICDVTVEMMDRLDHRLVYSEEDELLQKRFCSLMNSFNFSTPPISRVGRNFLKKHEHLLR